MPMPPELMALFERYNALGPLLPSEEDLDDPTKIAEAKLVLAEMTKTKAKIDGFLAGTRTKAARQ
jgi:hypothetical protein